MKTAHKKVDLKIHVSDFRIMTIGISSFKLGHPALQQQQSEGQCFEFKQTLNFGRSEGWNPILIQQTEVQVKFDPKVGGLRPLVFIHSHVLDPFGEIQFHSEQAIEVTTFPLNNVFVSIPSSISVIAQPTRKPVLRARRRAKEEYRFRPSSIGLSSH